jgi:hypothetical protein
MWSMVAGSTASISERSSFFAVRRGAAALREGRLKDTAYLAAQTRRGEGEAESAALTRFAVELRGAIAARVGSVRGKTFFVSLKQHPRGESGDFGLVTTLCTIDSATGKVSRCSSYLTMPVMQPWEGRGLTLKELNEAIVESYERYVKPQRRKRGG